MDTNDLTPQGLVKAMDPMFMAEFAVGWEDDKVLIARFGIDPKAWARIKRDKVFQAEISRIRAELEKDGRMSRYKARLYANDMLDVVYEQALASSTPLEKKIEALKVLARLADMEPKGTQKVEGASGVSITLNLSSPVKAQPVTIEAEVEEPEELTNG